MKNVYVVGSWESKFVVDRIFKKKKKAIEYCESRANARYDWAVMKVPFGGEWCDWETVHVVDVIKK